ncbi:arginine-tRNA protein transferase [Schizosaccharomyces cryophilus OY26]|uniref:arginyltransferase n=1 Tax=Schizosaccharomyces cryophilus (strain OY26 / ATCC MYA-4695 / CBS 11777 / NBRC 106824 / NRRL Y48691) TaxID=653667 RepID=S9XD00_SCHCR|nr:arginine-tRNA protein transferase [Schizosaccharomyces cryophilus OY26]EPY51716.1 arginine-tRNA protein transferase [Schizosaccharomyces cryophilus OY26]
MMNLNKFMFTGYNVSRDCGYCRSGEPTEHFGLLSKELKCEAYQDLVDRGWRRSGHYLYKPNLRTSCCPLYTIRLNADEFQITKVQKKTIKKWAKLVTGKPLNQKATKNSIEYLKNAFEQIEGYEDQTHSYTVKLESAEYTDEKFELFKKYQISVHHESEEEVTKKGFERFLCSSPLVTNNKYGSFHQLYRINGILVAVGVLDLLPHAVSSVYLFYDPEYSSFSLGRLSACREILLAAEEKYQFYYMGYYIHKCTKMRYKGDYSPSYLLNPETNDWLSIKHFTQLWEKGASDYVTFENVDENNDELKSKRVEPLPKLSDIDEEEPPSVYERSLPGILDEDAAKSLLRKNYITIGDSTLPLNAVLGLFPRLENLYIEANAALGSNVGKDYTLVFSQ